MDIIIPELLVAIVAIVVLVAIIYWTRKIKQLKEVVPVITACPTRAHRDNGQFASDNPGTPEVNEAWVGGKAPTKKPKAKK